MEQQSSIRIGTTYYKRVQKPLVGGNFAIGLLPWSIECIKQDHGKSFLSSIPKYEGFCFVPGHLNYKREIGRFYNSYHPFPHEPRPGFPKLTLAFLKHVFGGTARPGPRLHEGTAAVPDPNATDPLSGQH